MGGLFAAPVKESRLDPEWWEAMQNGTKLWEGRLGNKDWELGDRLRFQNRATEEWTETFRVVEIRQYVSFELAFSDLGPQLLPGADDVSAYANIKWGSQSPADAGLTSQQLVEKYGVKCVHLGL